jgi:hypothetical protein
VSLHAFDSFDDPDKLHSVTFSPRLVSGEQIAELPPLSIASIRVEA